MGHDFTPQHAFLVGIDSDGCAFDTMEVKHKECFIPNIVRAYHLAAVSKFAREAAEFVNLYSKWRGINRFPALLRTMDLLRERPEVRRRGVAIPELPSVRKWTETQSKLGNPALAAAAERAGDAELADCLAWSEAVNRSIAETVHKVPPFPFVRECLEKLAGKADVLVVSATPNEALEREWREHDIARHTARICGQEIGTKKEILGVAKGYAAAQTLMIGDAPGDLEAARKNDALFFPILPGREEESWERLFREGIGRFFAGRFAGDYEKTLVAEFEAVLPDAPPWKR